uniref:Uncharacterized protein n=1 Tax=Leersia perrieri TaxID=77586 RepID=A0A0D9X086_9ORYZ
MAMGGGAGMKKMAMGSSDASRSDGNDHGERQRFTQRAHDPMVTSTSSIWFLDRAGTGYQSRHDHDSREPAIVYARVKDLKSYWMAMGSEMAGLWARTGYAEGGVVVAKGGHFVMADNPFFLVLAICKWIFFLIFNKEMFHSKAVVLVISWAEQQKRRESGLGQFFQSILLGRLTPKS